MKRLLIFCWMLIQIASVLAQAWNFSAQVGSNTLYFTITDANSKTVKVMYPANHNWNGYTQPAGNLAIPSTVSNGGVTYSVTAIESDAFRSCSGLTSVTIPNTITTIGSSAFESCSGITSVSIPNSVTYIGISAFAGDSSLTSVNIPNTVTFLGGATFANCVSLASVTLPNAIDTIKPNTFAYCKNLTSVNIPASVKVIMEYAFRYCSCLTNITIPNSVTFIDYAAFAHDSSLTSVTIPNSVTYMGNAVFESCVNLTSITIPNSVTYLGSAAFEDCISLLSVTIPNKVTSIANSTFKNCKSLTSVTIPNSVKSIGSSAFGNCRSLTSVDIPRSVTYIDYYAFQNCKSLTSVTIHDSVTYVGARAFGGCSGLTTVYWNADSAYAGYNNISAFDSCTKISNFIFGNHIRYIPSFICRSLPSLTSVTIPNSVTCIGRDAFWGCKGITSYVIIPDSVTEIGNFAFSGCKNIPFFMFKRPTPPEFGDASFSVSLFYVPCGSLDLYAEKFFYDETIIELSNIFSVVPENKNKGWILISKYPSCSDKNAVIEAVPKSNYYRFDHWSDGNTDNPRLLYVTGDTSLVAYFTKKTSISDSEDSKVKVYASGNSIVIDLAHAPEYENEAVTVYDVLGREIAKGRLEGNSLRLPVQPSGIYIVKINGLMPYKVVVQ